MGAKFDHGRRDFIKILGAGALAILASPLLSCAKVKCEWDKLRGKACDNEDDALVDNRFFKQASFYDSRSKAEYIAEIQSDNPDFHNPTYTFDKSLWDAILYKDQANSSNNVNALNLSQSAFDELTDLINSIQSQSNVADITEIIISPDQPTETAKIIVGVNNGNVYGRFSLSSSTGSNLGAAQQLYNAAVNETSEAEAINLVNERIRQHDPSYTPNQNPPSVFTLYDYSNFPPPPLPFLGTIMPDLEANFTVPSGSIVTMLMLYDDAIAPGSITSSGDLALVSDYKQKNQDANGSPKNTSLGFLTFYRQASAAPNSGDGRLYILGKTEQEIRSLIALNP